jgi:hypothetical protein
MTRDTIEETYDIISVSKEKRMSKDSGSWAVFLEARRNPDPRTSLVIFKGELDRFQFFFLVKDSPLPYGCIADLTKLGQFTADSPMWCDEEMENHVCSTRLGTIFICLMADQEASYREHILPRRPAPDLCLTFQDMAG